MVLGVRVWGPEGSDPGWISVVLHRQGRVVGQWWFGGVLQVTPGLAPAESTMPPYSHVCACSELIRNTPDNSHVGHLSSPSGSVKSGSVHVPRQPLCALGNSWELLHQH